MLLMGGFLTFLSGIRGPSRSCNQRYLRLRPLRLQVVRSHCVTSLAGIEVTVASTSPNLAGFC